MYERREKCGVWGREGEKCGVWRREEEKCGVWGRERKKCGAGGALGDPPLFYLQTLSLLSLSLTLTLSLLSLSLSFLSFLSRFPANCWRTLTLSLSLSENSLSTNNMQAKLFVPLLLPVKSPAECCQCILNVIITPVEKE